MVTLSNSPGTMHITCLYGFPKCTQKMKTWDLLVNLRRTDEAPWLVIGDYNQILGPDDKVGGNLVGLNEIDAANRALLSCSLVEMDTMGYRYTWCNKRKSPHTIEEKLDRGFANRSPELIKRGGTKEVNPQKQGTEQQPLEVKGDQMIVHIDASSDNIISTGAGLIIQDVDEAFMVAACSLHPKTLDASMAECLTLIWDLEELKQLEIMHDVIITDCLPLAND
ncbi:hypothetical protein RIF29_24930 [Crotalaria pallida]|uniref:RNase H type-1 domain-containing protein n=1 Tax=Crotalaria pallida TaxID=3830 RepID=A0AAN9ELE5_CROPI